MLEQEKIDLSDLSLYDEFKFLSEKTSKKRLVLFFGRSTFSDNTKYTFLACQRANPSFEVIWCTAEKTLHDKLVNHGLPSFLVTENWRNTVTLFLEAACAVYCENPYAALWSLPILRGSLSGATQIQLWHGISVKHLDLMLIPHDGFNILSTSFRSNLVSACQIDFLASSSSHLDNFWVKAFGVSTLLRIGQARNEVFFRDAYHHELIDAIFTPQEEDVFQSNRIKVLVAPTWQRTNETWINTANFLAKLNDIGKKEGIDFYIKQHPFTLKVNQNSNTTTKLKHVHILDAGFDIYPWLRFFGAVISDYSSIMFDFLATGKPTLSLDMGDNTKPYEPDFKLIPTKSGLYEFNKYNFEDVLLSALKLHPKKDDQIQMIEMLYETDPTKTNDMLIDFITAEVDKKIVRKYKVETPQKINY
jgi:CDP-glycerol glycerophosphotransferase (TagB/SpsB family)